MDNIEHHYMKSAISQLEVAIELYKSERCYFSCITLAGAADEVFGKQLNLDGKTNALERDVEHLSSLLSPAELSEIGAEKGIRNNLNEPRNVTKHRREDEDFAYFNPKHEAFDLLQRAVENYLSLTGKATGKIYDFKFEQNPSFT